MRIGGRALAYAVGFIAMAGLTVGSVLYPMIGLAVVGVVLGVLAFLVLPKEHVAGVTGPMALGLLMLVPVQNISTYGSLKYVVLAVVGALALATLARRHSSFFGRPAGLWLFFAYFALVALATPRSLEPSSWNLFEGALISGLATAVIFAVMNPAERRRSLNVVVAMAALEAAYSLYELVAKSRPLWGYANANATTGDPSLMYNQIDTALVRSQGTFGHPLPLALFLLVGLALVIRGAGPRSRLMRIVVTGLLFAGCFAAGSRSALAVAVILVFMGLGKNRWKGLAVGSVLLTIGVLIAVDSGLLESAAFQRFVTSDSLSHRSGALDAVPGLLANQDMTATIFGNGYFSAYQLFRAGLLQTGNFFAVDNQMVMTLVEGGVLGLGVLVALVLLALKRIETSARLGLLSVIVFFFSFDVLSWPSGIALFGAFMGLAFSSRSNPVADPERSDQPQVRSLVLSRRS